MTKVCSLCKTKKSLNEFYKNKKGYLGVYSRCKTCCHILQRIYRAQTLEKAKTYQKAYRIRNAGKMKAWQKDYHARNLDKIKLRGKVYREQNRDKIKLQQKGYYQSSKEKRNRKHRQKLKTNPKFKLNKNISRVINLSLKGNKAGKHWEDLVGYTLEKLKKHIEKQFAEGMTWKKFLEGEIHIDHKIPIAVFNFTKPEHRDFKRCWALKNLQPLWAKDNLEKSAKLIKHFQPSLAL